MSGQQVLKHLKEIHKAKKSKLPPSILSPITYRNLVHGIKWCCFWGGLPFDYDTDKNLMVSSPRKYRLWLFVMVSQTINLLFYAIRVTSTAYLDDERKISLFDKAFGLLSTILNGVLVIMSVNTGMLHRTEFPLFVNLTLKFYTTIKENYTNQLGQKWRNGCEEIMLALRFMLITLPVLSTLHYFRNSDKPMYFTSLVPQESFLYPFTYVLCGVLRLLQQFSGWATVMGLSFPILAIVCTFLAVLEELRPGRKVYRTKPLLRRPESLRQVTRIAQITGIMVNVVSREVLMIIQTLITYTGAVCVFSVVRFWDQLTFNAKSMLVMSALSTVGVWSTILTVAVMTYTTSEKTFNSWRNFTWATKDKKFMKKFRKSIRPIQLDFSGFYYIRPKKILAFWNTMLWLIARALLTFPHPHH